MTEQEHTFPENPGTNSGNNDPTVFGTLELVPGKKLPAPYFSREELVEICKLWNSIPDLRSRISGMNPTKALSSIIKELSDYRINSTDETNQIKDLLHAEKEKVNQLADLIREKDAVIDSLKQQLDSAKQTIQSHEAALLRTKQEIEQSHAEAQQKIQAAEAKAASAQLKENQVLINVDPKLLYKIQHHKVQTLMIERGYFTKDNATPEAFFNVTGHEFLRVFFGIN